LIVSIRSYVFPRSAFSFLKAAFLGILYFRIDGMEKR
jgi:hypothetical protein